MTDFWDYSVWGTVSLVAVLLASLLAANALKRSVKFLKNSLIPTSVLGGIILLIISIVFKAISGKVMFDLPFFNYNGSQTLEIITYHCLALGFIATAFRPTSRKFTRERTKEIFNTGVTTVSTYLLQAVFGLGITLIAALIMTDFFPASGVLLPFGYGQGTGQALNYGNIYENDFGFVGGRSFGLTIAALGFLSASIGGVVHLNILKRKKKIVIVHTDEPEVLASENIQAPDEIPMNGSMDKVSVQMAFVVGTYFISYVFIYILGNLLPGFKSVLYGFNFLFGVLIASLITVILGKLRQKKIMHRQYLNEFLMNRISGFFFDLMVVAGIAAIRIDVLKQYWVVILILGIVGLFVTYFYNYFVAKKLFPAYVEEQFLAMYGMLTGTASTGIILLREIDPEFRSPASDNLIYQNFPAIVFGFPLMLLATYAPKEPFNTFLILIAFFFAMNVILFRKQIFSKRNRNDSKESTTKD